MQAVALLTVWLLLSGQIDPLAYVGSLTEELRSPARIAVAADGTVLVTDPYRYQTVRFDSAGTLVGTWSVPDCPLGVAVHADGRYFVSYRDRSGVGVSAGGLGAGVVRRYKEKMLAGLTFLKATWGAGSLADVSLDCSQNRSPHISV